MMLEKHEVNLLELRKVLIKEAGAILLEAAKKSKGWVIVRESLTYEMLDSGCDRSLWNSRSEAGILPGKVLQEDIYGNMMSSPQMDGIHFHGIYGSTMMGSRVGIILNETSKLFPLSKKDCEKEFSRKCCVYFYVYGCCPLNLKGLCKSKHHQQRPTCTFNSRCRVINCEMLHMKETGKYPFCRIGQRQLLRIRLDQKKAEKENESVDLTKSPKSKVVRRKSV